MASKRPIGITILVILYVLVAVLELAAVFVVPSLLNWISGGVLSSSTAGISGIARNALTAVYSVLLVISVIVFIVSMIIAYGLWTGKAWGWWIAVIVSGVGVLLGFGALLAGGLGAVGIIIDGIVLWYMLQKGVKSYFSIK